jgi:bacterioferritin-associated ferredoxin
MQVVSGQRSEAAMARIQRLSVLPVFMDLTGKRAVVVGGTDRAAWKAELFAAAVASGCRSLDAIGRALQAGTNCGSCRPEIRTIINAGRVQAAE